MMHYYLHLLLPFKQELLLLIAVFILLLVQIFGNKPQQEWTMQWMNLLLLITVLTGFWQVGYATDVSAMFQLTPFSAFEKSVLAFATYLISLQAYKWLLHHEHMIEFYVLLLASLLGMFCMLSATNLLFFYLGLELSTIPLAILANFHLQQKQSSEAAFKFIVSASFASALLLLGISFLYGSTGTLSFNGIATHLVVNTFSILAFVLFFTGLLFKISVVPFHLWTADVYQGAPVTVTAFLSVVSKASILFVLLNFLFKVFHSFAQVWHVMVLILLLLTIIIGNLFALRQQNFKRFMAFSSITQIGFILIALLGQNMAGSAAVVYFMVVYLFSNLCIFGVIALVAATTGKENIDDFKGFYQTNPFLAWVLLLGLFSLAGIPPTAGFFGKFFLILSGIQNARYFPWITFAALNLMVSLYYYLRVVVVVFHRESAAEIATIHIPQPVKLSFFICVAGVIIAGVGSWIYTYIYSLASAVF
ncbi:NADH-quinone oxidoreductase subunit N [Hydrotalea sp.]|uniref:NADH-quinone oxidoreductase subunit N n=1 Tax=Hydrotalea sp. TaxID=2881279 RepID=UPI00262F1C1F|nr:NADH-quinone oxidoreductase subunit N [Hydrotalea sp.]